MKNLALLFFFVLLLHGSSYALTNCAENANVVAPVLSEKAEKVYNANLRTAQDNFDRAPNDADAIIWLGRRTAYLGNYKAAIEIYTQGIETHPKDARMYRHRGHRFISIRCFDDAIKDFKYAAKLIKGKPDRVEPDGIPNARNIPTSTLQSNIWYHLGLAYYLKSNYKNALKAYRECLRVSKNPDMLVATTNWLYITLRRLGKSEKAKAVLVPITDDLDIIENDSYYKLLKIYQGKIKADDLLKEIESGSDGLSNASIGYGLGNWFFLNGEKEKAVKTFRTITNGDQWSSFGYIAAEAEIKGQKHDR